MRLIIAVGEAVGVILVLWLMVVLVLPVFFWTLGFCVTGKNRYETDKETAIRGVLVFSVIVAIAVLATMFLGDRQ